MSLPSEIYFPDSVIPVSHVCLVERVLCSCSPLREETRLKSLHVRGCLPLQQGNCQPGGITQRKSCRISDALLHCPGHCWEFRWEAHDRSCVWATRTLSGGSPELFGPTLLQVRNDVPWSGLVSVYHIEHNRMGLSGPEIHILDSWALLLSYLSGYFFSQENVHRWVLDLPGRPSAFPKLPLLLPFSLVSALLLERFLQHNHQRLHRVFRLTSHKYLIDGNSFFSE